MEEAIKENRFFKTNQQLLSLMPKILTNFEIKKEGDLKNIDILPGKCDLVMFDHISNDLIIIKRENESVATLYTIKILNSTINCSQLMSENISIFCLTRATDYISFIVRTKFNNFENEIEQKYIFCCSRDIKYKESFINDSVKYDTLLDSIRDKQNKLNEDTGLCIRRAV